MLGGVAQRLIRNIYYVYQYSVTLSSSAWSGFDFTFAAWRENRDFNALGKYLSHINCILYSINVGETFYLCIDNKKEVKVKFQVSEKRRQQLIYSKFREALIMSQLRLPLPQTSILILRTSVFMALSASDTKSI